MNPSIVILLVNALWIVLVAYLTIAARAFSTQGKEMEPDCRIGST